VFNWFWKVLIIVAVILGGIGAWMGWKNREAGIRLTAWARDPLRTWIIHSQECHSPGPPAHNPPPAYCTPPSDHIPPPPPPPSWDE
jgi:hypothetical protein